MSVRSGTVGVLLAGVLAGGAHAQPRVPASWPTLAGTPSRARVQPVAPPSIDKVRWLATVDDQSRPITFHPLIGPVSTVTRVYATGVSGGLDRAYAFDAMDGRCLWSSPIPEPWFDSWSTPAIDGEHLTLVVASGAAVTALDLFTGAPVWQADLLRPVVNASPAITTDLGASDRLFITDYDGFGSGASLYCINIDPFDPLLNPYQPGQIVWAAPIGRSSGNTPAYDQGTVYVCTAEGQMLAFDAAATSPPAPLWSATNPAGHGFFGGLAVSGGAVYAASYAFAGGIDSANLIKVDAATGAVVWSVACNRTASIPVRFDGGAIVLSGGLRGFGTVPTVELFQDNGGSVQPVWNSALATWQDLNGNGVIDPGEYLEVGGWTHHPVAFLDEGERRLICGVIGDGAQFEPYKRLLSLDLDAGPAGAFVKQQFEGAGSTPAHAEGTLYTIGQAGLYAFGPPCFADCDGDGALTIFDFLCFQSAFVSGDPFADCDGDGQFTFADFLCFQNAFQAGCPKGGTG